MLEEGLDVLAGLREAQGDEHFLQVHEADVSLAFRIQLLEEAFDIMYLLLIVVHLTLLAMFHQPVPRVGLRLEDVLGRLDVCRLRPLRQPLAELVIRLGHFSRVSLSGERFVQILVDCGLASVVDTWIQFHVLRVLGPVDIIVGSLAVGVPRRREWFGAQGLLFLRLELLLLLVEPRSRAPMRVQAAAVEAPGSSVCHSPQVLLRARNLPRLQASVDEVCRDLGHLSVLPEVLGLVADFIEVHQLALGTSSRVVEGLRPICLAAVLHVAACRAILVRQMARLLVCVPGPRLVDQRVRLRQLPLPIQVAICAG